MKNIRLSIYSTEHSALRQMFTQRRLELGLSQRALAERLGVIHSFIGKVETGDRRLVVFKNLCQSSKLPHKETTHEQTRI